MVTALAAVSRPSFSILERIDVGETITAALHERGWACLSVSSNGSTWVKLFGGDLV